MRPRTVLFTAAVAVAGLGGTAFVLERASAPAAADAQRAWGDGAPGAAPGDGMIFVSGGTYRIGDDVPHAAADAALRDVSVAPFRIDRHEVTNRQFAAFVDATGWVTTAEREGGGWVYRGGESDWRWVRGADWRHPLGAGSSIETAADHPVVLVSWHDARAYAEWAGKRLPTAAEWEVAARAGIPAGTSPPSPSPDANFWQGVWPAKNRMEDGYFYTAPVGSFEPSPTGLYDMIGNVWEWTADPYEGSTTLRVAKGGSWFCSPNYCSAYRPGFRGKSPADRGFNNVGFRCAADVIRAS